MVATSTNELLAKVRGAGLQLYVADGKLRVRGSRAGISPTLEAEIREHKEELRAVLSAVAEGGRDPFRATDGIPAVADSVADALADLDEGAVAKAHETKSTVPGQLPPLQEVERVLALAASVDWRQGVRCGRTSRQCRTCRGVPCRGSRGWQSPPVS